MEDFNTRLWQFMHSNELQQDAHNFYMYGPITYRDFRQIMFEHQAHARKFGLVWSDKLWKDVCKSEYMDWIKKRWEQLDSED